MIARRASEAFPRIDLDDFEKILLERREAVLKDVHGLEEEEAGTDGTVAGLSIHSADLGTDRAAHDVSLGCMESATSEVQEIDDALRRIREGSFGICDTCGEKIAKGRLEAIPYAKLCIPCKMAEEAL